MNRRTLVHMLAALSLFSLVAGIGPQSPAHAETTTTINFDDLTPGTVVSNQYDAQGVDFDKGVFGSLYYCQPVITQVSSQDAESGDQVADTSCYIGEFPDSAVWGVLKNDAENVSVYVGFFPNYANPPSSEGVTLTAYDADGNVLTSNTESVPTGQGTHTLLQVSVASPTIAQFTITSVQDQSNVYIDNLTFDNPAGVPPDFRIRSETYGGVTVQQGFSTDDVIDINRLNGSSGDITFGTSGLPSGASASFSPNPADGSSTTMTVSADPSAPLTTGSAPSFTVTGTPSSTAGPTPQSLSLTVDVVPNFTVVGPPTTIQLPPCSRVQIPVTVNWTYNKPPKFTGDVTLGINGLPSDDGASFSPSAVSFDPSTYSATSTLTLTSQTDVSASPASVTVTGTSGQYSYASGPFDVERVAPSITGASPGGGMTPQALKPGAVVSVYGHGFCPGTTVDFGNAMASSPALVSPNGTSMLTAVPRLATSGDLYAIPPNGSFGGPGVAQLPGFNVDSYRDVDGFSFDNSAQFQNWVGGWGFDDIAKVFGVDQTFISVNPCWPFYDCTIHTPIPTPGALIEWGLVNAIPWTGRCFGFSVASQRLLHGDESYSNFPLQPGAVYKTVWNLQGPDAPDFTPEASPDIAQYINDMQIEVVSSEFAKYWMGSVEYNDVFGSQSSIINQVTSALQSGDHPIVTLVSGGVSGFLNGQSHAVVAYDVEDGQNGDKIIDVYNPDAPFISDNGPDASAGEDSDTTGVTHQTNIQNSQIVVHSDGHWDFQGPPGGGPAAPWSGGPGGLVVVPYGIPPVHPTLPLLFLNGPITLSRHPSSHGRLGKTASTPPRFQGLWDFQIGSASVSQLTDSSGHTFLNPNGTLDKGGSRIPDAAPFGIDATHANIVLLGKPGGYTQTVAGKRNGDYRTEFLGPSTAAVVDAGSHAGIVDKISLLPNLAGLRFGQLSHGGSSRPLNAEILAGPPDGSQRSIVIGTDVPARGPATVGFGPHDNTVTISAGSKPMPLALTLSWAGPHGFPQTFAAPKLTLPAGSRASLAPASWPSLESSAATLTIVQRNGKKSTRILKNTVHGRASYSVTLKVTRKQAARRLTIQAKVTKLAKKSSATFLWEVFKGSILVRSHSVSLSGKQLHTGLVKQSFTFKPRAGTKYRFDAAVTIFTPTPTGSVLSQEKSKAARF